MSLTSTFETSQTGVLEGVLERVADASRGGGGRALVLFDLDDTLLSTNRRHVRILREFAAQHHVVSHWTREAARLSIVVPPPTAYNVTDIAQAAQVHDEELLGLLRAYWFARFFRNDYLIEDEQVPGAAAYCRRVQDAGADIVYLTGRDEAMHAGTMVSLSQHGFPMPDGFRTRLVLKPGFDTPDLEYKREALRAVAGWGEVAGGFENEPAHVNLFLEAFPRGRMVLVETKHSGRPVRPAPGVGRIRDFLQ